MVFMVADDLGALVVAPGKVGGKYRINACVKFIQNRTEETRATTENGRTEDPMAHRNPYLRRIGDLINHSMPLLLRF